MNRRWFLLGAAAALVVASSAEARMHAPYRAHHIVPGRQAPLDAFTTPSGAYSFRKLRSAYAGSAVRLRRASDNLELDIGFTAAGDFNTSAASTHCAATTCFGRTWYDQSGGARDLPQATAANQPQLIFNCVGSLPCFEITTATQVLNNGAFTPATGIATVSMVANRLAGTGLCIFRQGSGAGPRLSSAGVNTWIVTASSGSVSAINATDAVWHSGIGVVNAAASSILVDGVAVNGTVTGSVVAGNIAVFGAASTTCRFAEAINWDAVVLTAGEQAAVGNNQKDYWAPLPLDTFTQPSGAYSFRKLKSTYAGPAIRIRRASDNAELDINFLGFVPGLGAPWDVATATAHCAATTCFMAKWYDQSGLARDLVQTTTASQPQLLFNCIGSLPCARTTAAQDLTAAATVTPATGLVSMSAVADRVSGTGLCSHRQNGNNNRLGGTSGLANNWSLAAGTALSVTANDNVWHAAQGVINAAGTVVSIDGIETTGSVTGSVALGAAQIVGVAATTCNFGEFVIWDNYAMTLVERAALTNNQHSFWGF